MYIYIVFCNVHIMKGVLKMKKSLKKIITVVLTFAMMFAMTVPAYAKEVFKILKTNVSTTVIIFFSDFFIFNTPFMIWTLQNTIYIHF